MAELLELCLCFCDPGFWKACAECPGKCLSCIPALCDCFSTDCCSSIVCNNCSCCTSDCISSCFTSDSCLCSPDKCCLQALSSDCCEKLSNTCVDSCSFTNYLPDFSLFIQNFGHGCGNFLNNCCLRANCFPTILFVTNGHYVGNSRGANHHKKNKKAGNNKNKTANSHNVKPIKTKAAVIGIPSEGNIDYKKVQENLEEAAYKNSENSSIRPDIQGENPVFEKADAKKQYEEEGHLNRNLDEEVGKSKVFDLDNDENIANNH